jgi:hypothetical protein
LDHNPPNSRSTIGLTLAIPQLKPSPSPFVSVVIPLLEESPTSMVHLGSLTKLRGSSRVKAWQNIFGFVCISLRGDVRWLVSSWVCEKSFVQTLDNSSQNVLSSIKATVAQLDSWDSDLAGLGRRRHLLSLFDHCFSSAALHASLFFINATWLSQQSCLDVCGRSGVETWQSTQLERVRF